MKNDFSTGERLPNGRQISNVASHELDSGIESSGRVVSKYTNPRPLSL
jgi:hypothetical protein